MKVNSKKFWNWSNSTDENETVSERVLSINGPIAEDSWFDDDVTPALFKDELNAGEGDITVWINSPGGDCVAAAQIYNMLVDYSGNVTVKIDGMAASAASVIAMAGNKVLMSPVSMLMIHNPATIAMGDHNEMQKAIDMLSEVKESIMNAYAIKTGLSRAKLSHLMESETWMNANKAVELGFADGVLERESDTPNNSAAMEYSRKLTNTALMNKLNAKYTISAKATSDTGTSVADIKERLNVIGKFI
ncbi:MAG: head maturation protease, ClpP-related [Clostridia bacterium]